MHLVQCMNHAFGAVHENFLNIHHQRQIGNAVANSHKQAQPSVANDASRAANPERLTFARHNENQSDLGALQYIAEGISPPISRTLWDSDRFPVQNMDKAWEIPLGGNIDATSRIA